MTDFSATTETSDPELISQVRAGDIDAYGLLYDRHRDAAIRLARQLASGTEADDLVSESFAKLLQIIQGGGGPDVSFRAYLLTCVRRLHIDRLRADPIESTDDLEPFDPGTPFEDPALDDFERVATARAFASLPERWQLVLWHTEVEGDKPAEIAPLLGMTANSVAAMAYRAREGLRQAYLRAHLADTADDSCRWVTEHLGGFVRGGLSRRDHHKVESHLDDCRSCTAVYLELVEVNSNLRVLLAPILLGAAAAGYLTAAGHTGMGLAAPRWLRGRKVLRGHQGAAAAAVAAVAVTAIAASAVIGTRSADTDQSNGSGVSSKLADDSPSDGADSAEPTDRADRPNRGDHRGQAKNRRDELDRSHHAGDPQGVEDSPSARHGNADDSGQTESRSGDPTATKPTGTGNDPTQTTPTESTEPTSDPSTPTGTTEPTQPTEPTNDPSGPLADLGVGPKIHKHDFLGLLWNEVRIPASGVQKVDSATMVVTVQNLVSWSDSSGGGDVANWACSEVSTDTIQCTLDDVAQAGDPQDLGLSLTTSGTDSEVTASISASDYRDPKPGNNSVSTHVVL